ncbi:Crp/Fnr family transcriptional regulator [Longitalea luteola]|uniref:Crp/Fnr family transcriptional regulator n=1 Tax=Longitalea luteola TaxID=2812563 RepID=UPI001A973991|nr:cyclic nucleotide-binding domain-containing protein [Longitalea luteola]
MEEGLQQLKKHLFSMHPLSETEWEEMSGIWQLHQYKRKTILTAAGETERHVYFVLNGVQRIFYIDATHEATLVFTYPYSFSGIADSFLTQTPSRYFLETLTSSTLLRTTHTQIQQLMNKYRNIEKLLANFTAFALMGVLERQVELQTFSAEEKFKTLLKRSPHVLQLIPHKYLASYLGMDATTFSKLMASVRIE